MTLPQEELSLKEDFSIWIPTYFWNVKGILPSLALAYLKNKNKVCFLNSLSRYNMARQILLSVDAVPAIKCEHLTALSLRAWNLNKASSTIQLHIQFCSIQLWSFLQNIIWLTIPLFNYIYCHQSIWLKRFKF